MPMSEAPGEPDLIVIGGGPSGIGAATQAAACGLRVLLLDETQSTAAPRSPFDMRCGEAVWSVSGAYRVDTIGPGGPRHYHAPAIVAATGTQERVIPFPGWTTPGVIGLSATAALLQSHRAPPGRRVLIAGYGPLLAGVAAGVLRRGGQVAAVADLAPSRGWLARLRHPRVPILHRTAVTEVKPAAAGLDVAVGRIDAAGHALAGSPQRRFAVDALVVGHGLVPATDITRLLRADHAYDASRGFWHPVADSMGRSSLAGLYVAGGAAGTSGARAAHLSGRITGITVARDMGRMPAAAHARLVRPLRRKLAAALRPGRAMAAMMAPLLGLAEAIPAGTEICPCEHVTRADIDAAVLSGATQLNQLKAWTRCGMGPCQGRICADAAAALLSAHGITRPKAGQFTGRTPLRPLPLDLLTGDYAYADIALPPAAPP